MQEYIRQRAIETADHIISTKHTVREAAKFFMVSKSTVHKDVTERLPLIDTSRAAKVREVLDINTRERAIRGGDATKKLHLRLRDKTN